MYALASDGKVTPQQMATFIDRADKTKLKRAVEFLTQVQEDPTLLVQLLNSHRRPEAGDERLESRGLAP